MRQKQSDADSSFSKETGKQELRHVQQVLREPRMGLPEVFGYHFHYEIQIVSLDISLDFRHFLTKEATMRFIFLTSKGYNIFLPVSKPSDAA